MTESPPAADTQDVAATDDHGRERRRRSWAVWVVLPVLALAGAAGAYLQQRPAGNQTEPAAASPTATATVARQTLVAQARLDGTLGYDGPVPVMIPTGTDAEALRQAQDAVATARATLDADRTARADAIRSGRQSVAAARAAVGAATRAVTAAENARTASCAVPSSSECLPARQAVTTARDQLAQARASLDAARLQAAAANHQSQSKVDADKAALTSAQTALTHARQRATNPGVTVTSIAVVGTTVKRGQRLYALDNVTVPLFYGRVTPWRALYRGVSAGADVKALNDNLAALGYNTALAGRRDFTAATERAVKAWQKDMHAKRTGTVALGDVVYRIAAVVVTEVTATKGAAVQPGSVILGTASTTRVVTVALDAVRQGQVKVGDPVTVTLPNGKTTGGTVTAVGQVATSADAGSSADAAAKATINVVVQLADPEVAAGLDKAPVSVSITTDTVKNALVVPVTALLARAGGTYAVEVIDPDGTHRLVDVSLGLFDDAQGLVQVTDTDLEPGQHVVVPS